MSRPLAVMGMRSMWSWLLVGTVACASSPAARPAPVSSSTAITRAAPELPEAAYLRQVKAAIHAAWEPTAAWGSLPESTRPGYGTATRSVVLELGIASNGYVDRVGVVSSSGITRLDLAAVATATDAAPFGPTPSGAALAPFRIELTFTPPR